MRLKELHIKEEATAGATCSGNIATVVNPHVANPSRNSVAYTGTPGVSGKGPVKQYVAKKQKPTDNALDGDALLMSSKEPKMIRRRIQEGSLYQEGHRTLPPIDTERYTERKGLEGPMRARNGRVVYYDPKEGQYYDPDTDIYISNDEWEEMNESSLYQEGLWDWLTGGGDDKKEKLAKPKKKKPNRATVNLWRKMCKGGDEGSCQMLRDAGL